MSAVAVENDEIFQSVVVSNSIQVMDYLMGLERTLKELFHDVPMLTNGATVHWVAYDDVAESVVPSLPLWVCGTTGHIGFDSLAETRPLEHLPNSLRRHDELSSDLGN